MPLIGCSVLQMNSKLKDSNGNVVYEVESEPNSLVAVELPDGTKFTVDSRKVSLLDEIIKLSVLKEISK